MFSFKVLSYHDKYEVIIYGIGFFLCDVKPNLPVIYRFSRTVRSPDRMNSTPWSSRASGLRARPAGRACRGSVCRMAQDVISGEQLVTDDVRGRFCQMRSGR